MDSGKKILIIIIVGLVLLIAFLSFVNKNSLVEKKQINNEAIFTVIDNGQRVKDYRMEDVIKLGEKSFTANLKAGGKEKETHEYTGVLLKEILEDAEIKTDEKKCAVVSAIDGYTVAVDMKKVLEDDNVYLSFKKDGKWLETRENGGEGPYQLIISKDKFSQHWCKYAFSVAVN